MAASDYFNKYLNVEASAHYPAVFMNNIKINTRHVYQPNEILVVDVFHSDMSLSTVAALEFPKSYGHITLSCSQNNESHLAEICDLAIRAQGEKELFAKVRSGEVRVLFGSTPKMGAGTNVQDRLIAIHNLDCPWRPSDVGRILRTFKIKRMWR